VIKTSEQENLDMIAESVSYLKRRMDEVIYDAEHFFDGFRNNKEYALSTLMAAQQAGPTALPSATRTAACSPTNSSPLQEV